MKTIRRLLVSCALSDASPMAVLMEGCKAHSDVDALPIWAPDFPHEHEMHKRLAIFDSHEETWVALFPTRESLECFTALLATVEFKDPDFVRLSDLDCVPGSDSIWNIGQFHKHVFHGR